MIICANFVYKITPLYSTLCITRDALILNKLTIKAPITIPNKDEIQIKM